MAGSYRFVVAGRVQGVGFRHASVEKALSMGLRGWIRNREDGCVEGQVDGDAVQPLEGFRQFLERGPIAATVERLEWTSCGSSGESGFRILRD